MITLDFDKVKRFRREYNNDLRQYNIYYNQLKSLKKELYYILKTTDLKKVLLHDLNKSVSKIKQEIKTTKRCIRKFNKILKSTDGCLPLSEIQTKYESKFNTTVDKKELMDILDLYLNNKIIGIDYAGVYYYIKPYTKLVKTNKSELIKTLKDNVGKLLTIRFTKEDGTDRICNGQFTNHLTDLGYYHFKEKGQNIKQFDAKNLLEVRVNNIIYMKK